MEAPTTTATSIHSESWYFNQDGIARGPFASDFMETEFEKGTFAPDTLIWFPTQPNWLPLSACQPSWTVATSHAILRPGPLQIPLPNQSPNQPHTPPNLPADAPKSSRAPLKPIAHSEVPASPPPSKQGLLKRLFGRKP